MKTLFSLLAALALSAVIAGCSTPPTMKQLAEDSANASEVRAKAEQERRAQEQKHLENTLGQVPAWSLEPPRPDSNGIFAVGMGESDTLRVSMHKAMLDAEFGLAKAYGQELSGSERSITLDNNSKTTTAQYTELIDKLVTQVPVVGFEVVHQEVKAIDGKYHSFVLLKLPFDQFNSVLKSQAAKTDDVTVEKQFADLERRLDKRRQQRNDEAKQKNVVSEPSTAGVTTAKASATTSSATVVPE
jgi:hypothetical protein